ncbi:MAG: alanine--tRNA ligase [Gammaproteobacteria bacterium]|nr:alanine--tRNA ligase [Gammaproteobacteria bacterium]
MTSLSDLRSQFLTFFAKHGHTVVPSSSLVPGNDATLLFTNAGMVQFKDVFLGQDKRDYVRATSSQRCVRAGGKHNDLENVGYTARHHTFFEMLGNFSFGDYFKEDAIQFGWKFLTEELKLPAERLWITVFEDDQEAADIWLKKIGVSEKRFSRIGAKDNFWQMGETGPCGPCTEIFYDHGAQIAGGPPGSPDEDGDRYIEIWNLVFMQYNRDANGTLTPLPKPSVDTGMGLERIAAVLQGVHSNYEIDLFRDLLAAATEAVGTTDVNNNSLKVIADHIRSCAFLIADGVVPSNEGRGYVLRRIIRRAIRHGYKLGQEKPFFYQLVAALARVMGDAYPELRVQQIQIERTLQNEEERFAETLEQGMAILDTAIAQLKTKTLPGDVVFKLYDTYGFPVDLTADIARERNLELDLQGFDAAMNQQRERARAASRFNVDLSQRLSLEGESRFSGYEQLDDQGNIINLLLDAAPVQQLAMGQEAIVVLDSTPFYAESGGQAGDRGQLITKTAVFEVDDTQKQGNVFLHIGRVIKGELKLNDQVEARVNIAARQATAWNHSATHLMHAALREVLGKHVQQKGSLVNEQRLRFDFSHGEPVNDKQLQAIERLVNQEIRQNTATQTNVMSMDDAVKSGAMALFGEKYADDVRVLTIGFSKELCGGTHVARTGDIGLFKIISETGVAAGVRRIEAITGDNALAWYEQQNQQLMTLASALKIGREQVVDKVLQLQTQQRELEKQLQQLKSKVASQQSGDIAAQVEIIAGVNVLVARMDGVDAKALREMADQLKDKLGSVIVVLGAVEDDKVRLVAGVTNDLMDKFKAGDIINKVALQVGGKGGGRADMAQAGGTDPSALDDALNSVKVWIAQA